LSDPGKARKSNVVGVSVQQKNGFEKEKRIQGYTSLGHYTPERQGTENAFSQLRRLLQNDLLTYNNLTLTGLSNQQALVALKFKR